MSPVSLLLAEQAQGLQWAGAGVLEVLTALYHKTTKQRLRFSKIEMLSFLTHWDHP